METIKRVLVWSGRNERHLGAVLFVFGFVTDLFTFAFLPVSFVNLAFVVYLLLATLCTLGSHLFAGAREHRDLWRRVLSIVFPLGAQYAIGSLLSGCLIFYSKSASVFVSWPFLLLIVLVFIGNEYFRTYHKHLAFQVVLLFFGLYAYSIFALPLFVHRLGPVVFLGSTGVSLVLFTAFLFMLKKVRQTGYEASRRYIVLGVALIVGLMNLFYFTGVIPPIPLTLPTVGIYHRVEKRDGQYLVTAEKDTSWLRVGSPTIHHVSGTPLYAFSAVSAPISFGTSIVHVWEKYDTQKKKWVVKNRYTFPINGGRDGGYRGYSEVTNPEAGKWRLTIETSDKQVVGRLNFTVQNVDTQPQMIEQIK